MPPKPVKRSTDRLRGRLMRRYPLMTPPKPTRDSRFLHGRIHDRDAETAGDIALPVDPVPIPAVI
jgi:hypothetical protein